MKNYVQAGVNLTLPAPYALKGGDGALVGLIFGIAAEDAAQDGEVDLVTKGVFNLAKVGADAFAVGAAVYWNNTSKLATSTVGSNAKIGVAVSASVSGAASVAVRLNGAF
ncbi:DUF2190 family protein [Hansschlegelia plantiphila]|uniref:DUF2190 family protein n=1 Tax=Hansschlegelia plantiphila TaxID=374655 RepID=A0A9W6MUP6_9HYPH|nr:DUF2190 family protein [Hansschlegelia plantiphila]GLK67046.1 hypothetical protein GCM10008179_06840 [Hansschlegelia plantiphila]